MNYSQTVFPPETPLYVKNIFNQSVAEGDEVTATLIGMGVQHYNFTTFSRVNFTANNPIANFLPFHCTKKSDSGATPIIAYSGNETYIKPILKDLEIMFKL